MDTNNPASAVKPGPVFQYHRSSNYDTDSVWEGASKILIAIDIGTTHSGVAFTLLQTGVRKSVHMVTQWPGQESSIGDSKVPSLIWYDSNSKPTSFGAEAQTPKVEEKAEDYGWKLARHFKLHLHPADLRDKHNIVLEPLPSGVPLDQVYSDFLRYLLEQTQRFFEDRIVDGARVWQSYYPHMDIVISHPNGYGVGEQTFLRSAAVTAGFMTSDKAQNHVHFVTEAEASVYYCLSYADIKRNIQVGTNVVVCDAGGLTVDTALYTIQATSPGLELKEVGEPACVQSGAIFVDRLAESYLRRLFKSAGLSPDDISDYATAGTRDFEIQAKRSFNEATDASYIEIGGSRLNIPNLSVRRGRLTLAGSTTQLFFDRCVSEIVASVELQASSSSSPVPYVLLVGGFGDSPYLRKQLRAWFEPMKTRLATPNERGMKAVALGAITWHCANQIIAFTPHWTLGIETDAPFDQANAEHRGRAQIEKPTGIHVNGKWLPVFQKGKVITISTDSVPRKIYTREYSEPDLDLGSLNEVFYVYGLDDSPEWLKDKSGQLLDEFMRICTFTADLNNMRKALQPRINASGALCWALTFHMCIRFDGVDLDTCLKWAEEDGIKSMPVNVILET